MVESRSSPAPWQHVSCKTSCCAGVALALFQGNAYSASKADVFLKVCQSRRVPAVPFPRKRLLGIKTSCFSQNLPRGKRPSWPISKETLTRHQNLLISLEFASRDLSQLALFQGNTCSTSKPFVFLRSCLPGHVHSFQGNAYSQTSCLLKNLPAGRVPASSFPRKRSLGIKICCFL